MKKNSPIAISILSYNGGIEVVRCLQSLEHIGADIYVLDNASKDDTLTLLHANFDSIKNVHIIKNRVNVGFSPGHNQVLDIIRGKYEYYWLLNQDLVLNDNQILEKLIAHSIKFDNKCLLQPLIKNFDGTIGNAGLFAQFAGVSAQNKEVKPELVYEVGYVSGAAVFFSQQTLELLGGFNPIFFAYHEDTELSFRAQLLGLKTMVCTDCTVMHDHVFGKSQFKFKLIDRNKIILNLMYYDTFSLIILFPSFVLAELMSTAYFCMNGWWGLKFTVIKEVFVLRRQIWQSRKKIMKIRKENDTWKSFVMRLDHRVPSDDFGNNAVIKIGIGLANIFFFINLWIYKQIVKLFY
jgi:GT2 family glycosyltransferase